MATIERRWMCPECGEHYRRIDHCIDCHGNSAIKDHWAGECHEEVWFCECGEQFETADDAAEHAEWCKGADLRAG